MDRQAAMWRTFRQSEHPDPTSCCRSRAAGMVKWSIPNLYKINRRPHFCLLACLHTAHVDIAVISVARKAACQQFLVTFIAQPPHLHRLALVTRASWQTAYSPCSTAPSMPFLFIGSRFMLHNSFQYSVALMQLRFTLVTVTSSQQRLHPQGINRYAKYSFQHVFIESLT